MRRRGGTTDAPHCDAMASTMRLTIDHLELDRSRVQIQLRKTILPSPSCSSLVTCAPMGAQRTRHAATQRHDMGDSPHAQRASSVPRQSSNYDKRYHHRRSIISLRARHLRVEEDTTDAPRCDSMTRTQSTHHRPERRKSKIAACSAMLESPQPEAGGVAVCMKVVALPA